MISLLQVFRGLAALLVVYHHTNYEVVEMFGDNWLRSLFDLGDAGVQFFFVLSGFIIYYVHRSDIGQPAQARRFLIKRIIRIYPIYILVTLALTPFWAFIPGFGAWYHKELMPFIYSILLIPQDHVPHLGVAWTLTHEVLFYLLFALAVLSRRVGVVVLATWFLAIAVVTVGTAEDPPFPWSFLFSVNNLLFGFGIVAAISVSKSSLKKDRGWLLVTLGSLAFLATGVVANLIESAGHASTRLFRIEILLLGLASYVIVRQSASASVERVLSKRRLLNAIGAASFSIYLIHQPVLSVFRKGGELVGIDELLGEHLFFIVAMIVAVTAGMAMYYLLERPMLRYLTARLVPSKNASRPKTPVSVMVASSRHSAA